MKFEQMLLWFQILAPNHGNAAPAAFPSLKHFLSPFFRPGQFLTQILFSFMKSFFPFPAQTSTYSI
jgi:hypothetical protein